MTHLWFTYDDEHNYFYVMIHHPDTVFPDEAIVSTDGEALWMSCNYSEYQPFARIIFETLQKKCLPKQSVKVDVYLYDKLIDQFTYSSYADYRFHTILNAEDYLYVIENQIPPNHPELRYEFRKETYSTLVEVKNAE